MEKYRLVYKIRQKKFKKRSAFHKQIPNILNHNFKAVKTGIKFAIDITYMPVEKSKHRWAYVCAIKDLFNGEIASYSISKSKNLQLVLDAVKGLKRRGFMKGALLYSDQELQFTNPVYITFLKDMGITQSMSSKTNCWDNACIENFFDHLKCEMYHFKQPETFCEVYEAVEDYIDYYNNKRIKTKLKCSTVEYRLKWEAA